MDVRSGYTNIQSEWWLSVKMIKRVVPFDEYRLEPGGWLPTPDYYDIKPELFSDVKTPVIFNNKVANEAGFQNLQTWRRSIQRVRNTECSTECSSRWYIPQAETYSGCSYSPVLYMEADSLYGPAGPIHVGSLTGEGTLIRDVRLKIDQSSGSVAR